MSQDPLFTYLARPGRRRLARVVAAHHRHVWNLAFRLTRNEDDAFDIAQEVFLDLFVDPPSIDEVSSPRGFLAWRVVARTSRRRRSLERQRRREAEHAQRVAQDVVDNDDVEAVREALGTLDEPERAALELRYLAGVPTSEMARLLGLSDRAVRLRLERARDRLRARLSRSFSGVGPVLSGAFVPREISPPSGVFEQLLRVAELGDALGPSTTMAMEASFGSVPSALKLGGVVLSTKKTIACAITAALILGGFALHVAFNSGGTDPGDANSRVSSNTTETVQQSGEASATSVFRGERPDVGERAEGVATVEPPLSIHGHVHARDGSHVSGAELWACDTAAWERVAVQASSGALSGGVDVSGTLAEVRDSFSQLLQQAPRAQSDAQGLYTFRGLAPGVYRLVVLHASFLPDNDALVELSETAIERDIVLTLAATISGRVVDDSGAPVVAAVIEQQPSSQRIASQAEIVSRTLKRWGAGLFAVDERQVATDAAGRFVVPSLEPLLYDLAARQPGRMPAIAHDVPAGSEGVVLVLEPGRTITGRVVDEAGSPIEGALVEAVAGRSPEVHRYFDQRVDVDHLASVEEREARSDVDGHFVLTALPAGHWDLRFRSADHAPLERQVVLEGDSIDLGEVKLTEPQVVRGRVVTRDGRPVAGALVGAAPALRDVRASNRITRDLPEPTVEVVSAVDGSFTLSRPPASSVDVLADHVDHAVAVVRGVTAGTTDLVIELAEGHSIRGRVLRGNTEEPVPGATVRSQFGVGRETETDTQGRFEVRGLSFADTWRGEARLVVRHGDFDVERVRVPLQTHDPQREVVVRLRRLAWVEGRVVDDTGQGVRGASLSYVVRGLPIEAAGYDPTRGIHTASTADGTFRLRAPEGLERMMGNIHLSLEARRSGFARGRHDFPELPATGDPWPMVELVLEPGATLQGVVRDEAGGAIAGARVEARAPESASPASAIAPRRLASALSNSRGRFTLRDLASERTVEVIVHAAGFAPTSARAVADRGPIELVLVRGRRLRGRVVDQDGVPISEAEVVALHGGMAEHLDEITSAFARRMFLRMGVGGQRARTDARGEFSLVDLPTEDLVLTAHASGYEAAVTTVPRGRESAGEIVLERFSAITGRVLDAWTGKPIRSFALNVVNTERRAREQERTHMHDPRLGSEGSLTFHDPLGRFFYDGLRSGPYELFFTSDSHGLRIESLELGVGEERELEVLLDPGGAIDVRVVFDDSELPLRGAAVGAAPAEGRHVPFATRSEAYTHSDGWARTEGLEPGEYQVYAAHPYALPLAGEAATVKVVAGDTAQTIVRVRPAGRLEGALRGLPTRTEGEARTRHHIELESLAEDAARGDSENSGPLPGHGRPISVRPEGTFDRDALEPGRYRLTLVSQDIEDGETISIGPNSGFASTRRVGPQRRLDLGEISVTARETTRLELRIPDHHRQR